MRVIQAQSAGFCYGVERAVRMAEEAAAAGGCVMLGSIIPVSYTHLLCGTTRTACSGCTSTART